MTRETIPPGPEANAFIDESRHSGDTVQITLRADFKQIFWAWLSLLIVAAGLFFLTRYLCISQLRFRYEKTANIVAAIPSGLFVLSASWVLLKPLLTSYQLTHLFVSETANRIFYKTLETCDMRDVKDVRLVDSLGMCTLTLVTKDISSPNIKISFLNSKDALEARDFVRRHAVTSYSEMAKSKFR